MSEQQSEKMTNQFGKVAVFLGGRSAERAISLRSGQAVLDALLRQGIDAMAIDPKTISAQEIAQMNIDRAVIMLHGREGEDGVIQGFLQMLNIPYTGSGVAASSLAMNKLQSKRVWQAEGLPTAPYTIAFRDQVLNPDDARRIFARLGPVLFVKPINEGSSVGMSKVKSPKELLEAINLAAKYDQTILIEQFIDGDEYTVALLDGRCLPSIRMSTPRDFYDYEAKYESQTTEYFCPSGLTESEEVQLATLAEKAWIQIGMSGWGRIDFIRRRLDGKFFLLEANTVPGMTETSLVPKAAKAAGMDFDALVLNILKTCRTSQAISVGRDA